MTTRCILITGAGSGIGAGIAAELATAGHHLVVTDLDLAAASAVVAITDRLRARRPGLRIVLVTARPDELTALLAQETGRVAPIVLSKPAGGADVLRALRSHPSA